MVFQAEADNTTIKQPYIHIHTHAQHITYTAHKKGNGS